MPFGIQPTHIIIILVIAFLLFGANRLPELGRSMGKTISEFRKGTREAAEGFKEEVATPATPSQSTFKANSTAPAGSFCIQCGAPNPVEARFCASCGTKLPEKAS